MAQCLGGAGTIGLDKSLAQGRGCHATNLSANQPLLDILGTMAADKGITPAQLALAWVLHQGDFIVPIPGARKIRHLEENAGAATVALSDEDLAAIERAMPKEAINGSRYTAEALAMVDS